MVSNNLIFDQDQQAILRTLLYSDIFDFPLKKEEIWWFLQNDKKISKEAFAKALGKLSGVISVKNGYYCLRGKEQTILYRKKNLKELQKKMHIAQRATFFLSFIPTIYFIGISGSLAREKANTQDDIDFFIITKKNTLFMTRFLILCILEGLGLRRKRTDTQSPNKICVNLLIDETKLAWPRTKRDLYTAHEIIALKPLFERQMGFERFLAANQWVSAFFPNIHGERKHIAGKKRRTDYVSLAILSNLLQIGRFETLIKQIQKKYMKRYQTVEVVTNTILALHPIDYRTKIMTDLRSKCDKLGLLTNF